MTPTESIFAAWLFLLTLAAIGLFVGWLGHRAAFNDMVKSFEEIATRIRQMLESSKPKRQRRTSKADIPIVLVPTPPSERIDLSTPLAERAQTAMAIGAVTFSDVVVIEPGFGVGGVGGTKADGEGGAA